MRLIQLDVNDDESVQAAVQQVIDHHGRIDVLVNNAGVGSIGAADQTPNAALQHEHPH